MNKRLVDVKQLDELTKLNPPNVEVTGNKINQRENTN